jgi:hypothetical protein
MEIISKAIETTGMIDDKTHITLDEPLPDIGRKRIRVIVLIPEEEEIPEDTWLQAAEANQAFSFLKDAEEDIYTLEDGKPFHDQG